MGLSGPRRPDERQIAVGVDGCEGRQRLQRIQVLAPQQIEVEVFKGLWSFRRQAAHAEQRLYGCFFLLFSQIGEHGLNRIQLVLRKALFLCQYRKLLSGKVYLEQLRCRFDRFKCLILNMLTYLASNACVRTNRPLLAA